MPPGTGKAKDPDAEHIAQTVLSAIAPLFEKHSKEMQDRIFGPGPTSLQSQITAIDERAFGDSPVSLRSRLTELETSRKVSKAKVATIIAGCSALSTLLGIKAKAVANFLAHLYGN